MSVTSADISDALSSRRYTPVLVDISTMLDAAIEDELETFDFTQIEKRHQSRPYHSLTDSTDV